jgi:putative transposase
MPRQARLAIPGISYHVTQRGNYQQNVFLTEQDRALYLGLVVRAACDYGLTTLGWCLMTNHVHWIVNPSETTSMAFTFRRAHSQYSIFVNGMHHRRRGHLWQGRFYSCPLSEGHLFAALAYVERNPVRANLAFEAENYPWSSAAAHTGRRPSPPFLCLEPWSELHSPETWHPFLQTQTASEENALRNRTAQGKPWGDEAFIASLEQKTGRDLHTRLRGRPPRESAPIQTDLESSFSRKEKCDLMGSVPF